MSAHLRLAGEPMLDVVDVHEETDDFRSWRRERLERPEPCMACGRQTAMGIRYLPDGPGGVIVPRCLRCWLDGVFQDRGVAMHLIHGGNEPKCSADGPATEHEVKDPFTAAVDAVHAALVSRIYAVDARQGQCAAASRRVRQAVEEAVLRGVTVTTIARAWGEQRVSKVYTGVGLAEAILDRAMTGRPLPRTSSSRRGGKSVDSA